MVDVERIKQLLGNGVVPSMVAEVVGCDISYISQLFKDETFASEVANVRAKDLLKLKTIDEKYDNLEDELLEKLKDLLPFFTKPRDVLAALQMVNGAKRKATAAIGADMTSGQVVKLTLPNIIVNNYKINMVGGMVEVGGRDLTPLPSSILLKTLEDKRSESAPNEQKIDDSKPKQLSGPTTLKNVPSERIISQESV